MADGRGNKQLREPFGGSIGVGEPHHHVETLVALDDLRHDAAIRQPVQRFRDGRWRYAIERDPLEVYGNAKLRDPHLLLDLKVDKPWHRRQLGSEALGERAQRVDILAVDLQRNLGAHPRQQMVEAVRDWLADVDRGGQGCERCANVCQDLRLGTSRWLEIDIDLARMNAFCVLIEFSPTGATSHRKNFGNCKDQLFRDQSEPVRFSQRNARRVERADRQRAFVEGWQERAGKCRDCKRSYHDRSCHCGAKHTTMPEG